MGILRTLRYYGYFRKHLYFYYRFLTEMAIQRFTPRRRLLLAEIFFERRCNFRCWHCSSAEYTEKSVPKASRLGNSKVLCGNYNLSALCLSATWEANRPSTRSFPRLSG